MARNSAKMRKLINNPSLFFRDMVAKKFRNTSSTAKNPTIAVKAAKPAVAAKAAKPAVAAKAAATKKIGPLTHYVENYASTLVDDNLVLFDAFWGRKVGCNPYAIYRAMRDDPRFNEFKFIWVKNKDVHAPRDVSNDLRVTFAPHASQEHADALLRAGLLIHNSNLPPYFNKKRKQRVVATWHGVPLKTLGFDANPALSQSSNTQRNFLFSDHIIVSSDYAKIKTIASYGASAAIDRARVIGSPRIDLTLGASPQAVREELGIHDDRSILLFAPTWRGKIGCVSDDIHDQIAAVAALEKAFSTSHHILVSLHHLTRKALADQQVDVKHIPDDVDINRILAATDVLVSDYSRIFIDYLVLDRPIVLFVPDREKYEDERGLYLPLERMPAAISHDFHSLEESVRALRRPSTFESYSEIYSTFLPHEDGVSSQRLLNLLDQQTAVSETLSRKRVLIHPGGLLNNGITNSFLNLTRNFDYNSADLFVILSDADLDKDNNRYNNFRQIDQRCQLVLRTGITGVPNSYRDIYDDFIKGKRDLSEHELSRIIDIFEIESRRVFCGLQFDVAIDFSGYSPFWSMLISRAPAKRKIAYQHSDMMSEATNIGRMKSSLRSVFQTYRYYDSLVSVSSEVCQSNKESLSKYVTDETCFTFAKNMITPKVIINCANEPIALSTPSLYPIVNDPTIFKFVSIGRLSPEKNHPRLLRAFAKVLKNNPNAVLFVIGAGPMDNELKSLSEKMKIESRVIFVGHLHNPYPLLKASDCLVFPSDYEGQGLVLLEALTLGVPCIATDFPAAKGIVRDGDGFICSKNSNSMAEAMLRIMSEPRGERLFNAEYYVRDAMSEFYNNVLRLETIDQAQASTRTMASNSA